jgi:hypothetical protein
MALNIATLVSVLSAGKQASAADAAVIQNISAQASRDLNLLQSLYSEYKASPNGTTLQKIRNVISALTRTCRRCSQRTSGTQCCRRESPLP